MNKDKGFSYMEKYFLVTDYQTMELLGVNGLFTNFRVDRKSLPEGFYKYSLREGQEDIFSSVKNDVFANHMGDFICKQELDLNGQDEFDLFGDYDFTGEEVNLDEFFGVDIKLKVAEELESFYYDYLYYEYQDALEPNQTRGDVVEDTRSQLNDKELVGGMLKDLKLTLSENADDEELVNRAGSLISALEKINSTNRDSLDNIVGLATEIKEQQTQELQGKEPEIQQ